MKYTLTRLSRPGGPAVGLTSSSSDAALYVTVQCRGLLKVSKDGRSNWALDSPEADFPLPAAGHKSLDDLFLVVGGARGEYKVRQWKDSDPVVELSPTSYEPLDRPVFSIHPIARKERPDCFIVYVDGSVTLYSTLRASSPPLTSFTEQLVSTSSQNGMLATVSCVSKQIFVLRTYAHKVHDVAQSSETVVKAPAEAAVLSTSLHEDRLGILWDQGSLDVYTFEMTGKEKWRKIISARLKGFCKATNPPPAYNGLANGIGKHKPRQALDPDETSSAKAEGCLVLDDSFATCFFWDRSAGADSNQAPLPSPAAAGMQLHVIVVDLSYGSVVVDECLLREEVRDYRKKGTLQAVRLTQGRFAILAAGSVFMLDLKAPTPALADLIGTVTAVNRNSIPRAAHPIRQRLVQHAVLGDRLSWLPEAGIGDDQSPEVAVPLETRQPSGNQMLAAERRDKTVLQLQARIKDVATYSTDADAGKLALDVARILAPRQKEPSAQLPLDSVAALMQQLGRQGAWDAMLIVWKAVPPPHAYCTAALMPILAAARQHRLLAGLLPTVRDWRAEDASQTLLTLFEPITTDADRTWQAHLDTEAGRAIDSAMAATPPSSELLQGAANAAALVHGLSAKEVALHSLVAADLGSELLWQVMGSISPTSAIRLFRYLHRLQSNFAELGACAYGLMLSSGAAMPPLSHIQGWLASLVDRHFVILASSDASTPLAKGAHSLATDLLAGLDRMSGLLGVLSRGQSDATAASCHTSGALYTIEVLDIGMK